jgi:ATP-dependent Clp protease ATP-binding subunit ClpB
MAEPAGGSGRYQSGRKFLDLDRKSPKARHFADQLGARIVGQQAAVFALSGLYEIFLAGMSAPRRPIGTLLFLGPTGSGKTRVVEAAAEVLFGDPRALIKIDCGEFQHAHEIARLIGPPPGYVGHKDTAPLLSQENLDRFQKPETDLTLVLFDEIEKASEALWQLLLGILDRATLTLGDNRQVDFSRTIIVMTSNLGATEMGEVVSGGFGFGPARQSMDERRLHKNIQRAGLEAARRRFAPEFMNRIDKTIVFRSLGAEDLRHILDLELEAVQLRLLRARGTRFRFRCTDDAKDFLLAEGTEAKYGARHLKRAIERHLVQPLSTLVATEQVLLGDVVEVDLDESGSTLLFSRCSTGELIRDLEEPVQPESAPLPAAALGVEEVEAQVATTIAVATAAALTGVIIQLMKQHDPPAAS